MGIGSDGEGAGMLKMKGVQMVKGVMPSNEYTLFIYSERHSDSCYQAYPSNGQGSEILCSY